MTGWEEMMQLTLSARPTIFGTPSSKLSQTSLASLISLNFQSSVTPTVERSSQDTHSYKIQALQEVSKPQ